VKIAMFYHSLLSDWNHGSAHFLRGIVWEVKQRGHEVAVFEAADGWSLANLRREHGVEPIAQFRRAYPGLESISYRIADLDFDKMLGGVDLVLVHEWNDPDLVRRLGAHRKATARYRLLFHDTHHRSVTDPAAIAAYDLSGYDGVLAYGKAIADVYIERRWARRVWIWHEAADTRIFRPLPESRKDLDIVWVGNWGDDERTEELREFLLTPARALGLKAAVYGVRYPMSALRALADAGIEYRGWLPNFRVPEIFARARATVHIPRRPYAAALPGIPTIRPFEALACATPLVCAPWRDSENLFTPGEDYLVARDSTEMTAHLAMLYKRPERAQTLAGHGLRTVLQRHTCAHRAEELLAIYRELARSDQISRCTSAEIAHGRTP
jgi:spore maturation protein CgeB